MSDSLQQQLSALLSTPDAFEAWLKEQDEARTFSTRSCFENPVAKCLASKMHRVVSVDDVMVHTIDGQTDAPEWLSEYIGHIFSISHRITAARALAVLQKVREELSV